MAELAAKRLRITAPDHRHLGALAAELRRFDEAIRHLHETETLAALPSEKEFIARRIREYERRCPC